MSKTIYPFIEYIDNLHQLMMFCMDCTRGFSLVLKDTQDAQQQTIKYLKKTDFQKANLKYLDSVSFTYGRGRPDDPNALILAHSSQGDLKKRNFKNGKNTNLTAFSVISFAYGLWESKYRKEITGYLGLEKLIDVDPMGDLRNFRHDILHNRGVASKKNTCKNVIFKWFSDGDALEFTEDMMVDILLQIKTCLQEIYYDHMGKKVKLSKFLTTIGPGHTVKK